jgi:hypothetical protein
MMVQFLATRGAAFGHLQILAENAAFAASGTAAGKAPLE